MCPSGQTERAGTNPKVFFAVIFNFNPLCLKTLNSRMNIIETRAVLNIVKTDGKCAPEAKWEGCNFQFQATFLEET